MLQLITCGHMYSREITLPFVCQMRCFTQFYFFDIGKKRYGQRGGGGLGHGVGKRSFLSLKGHLQVYIKSPRFKPISPCFMALFYRSPRLSFTIFYKHILAEIHLNLSISSDWNKRKYVLAYLNRTSFQEFNKFYES